MKAKKKQKKKNKIDLKIRFRHDKPLTRLTKSDKSRL